MRTIFRYPGGKSKRAAKDWILQSKPALVNEYRETCVGGGGIFWSLGGVPKRWINDIHPGLMDVYKSLRDRPTEFINLCRSIPIKDIKALFDAVKLDATCDQALRYYVVNRTVFNGRVNYRTPTKRIMHQSYPEGWGIVNQPVMEEAAQFLADVQISCGSYEPLLDAPGEDVWIYVDPPYVRNTFLTPPDQLYEYGFTVEQHEKLAADIRKCKHRVTLSYDNHEIVRSLYPSSDFHIIENTWIYGGTTQKRKSVGCELLILNYEPNIKEI